MSQSTPTQQKRVTVEIQSSGFTRTGERVGRLYLLGRQLVSWSRAYPTTAMMLLFLSVNGLHSFFNIGYNILLIRNRFMSPFQIVAFDPLALVGYNVVAYGVLPTFVILALYPLRRVHARVLKGEKISQTELEETQRLLIDVPFIYVCFNVVAWLPGAFFFPMFICLVGGTHNWQFIWGQFLLSFTFNALITIMQIFFILESFLIRVLYPLYFRDTKPINVKGEAPRLSFLTRMIMMFAAVSGMPLLAVVLLAYNFANSEAEYVFVTAVFIVSVFTGSWIAVIVSTGFWRWITQHQNVTEEISKGNLTLRVLEKRPDEWGRLTDGFNDMAQGLEDAEKLRRKFGEVKNPAVRDAMIERWDGIAGETCDISVMFADIRGFTERSRGEQPEEVFKLLNRYLTLAVKAIESNHGIVDKFLGDGVMALFGTPVPPPARPDHADMALKAAFDMLKRMDRLNRELIEEEDRLPEAERKGPLKIGIGIHSGPAFIGCPGATIEKEDGTETLRLDFTALGETVNLAQRTEQFTKKFDTPLVISQQTSRRLTHMTALKDLGTWEVPGYGGTIVLYQVILNHELAKWQLDL